MARFFYIFPEQATLGPIDRASLAHFHRTLCHAILRAGDTPVFVVDGDNLAPAWLATLEDAPEFMTTTLAEFGHDPALPVAQTSGVWFDNAISWSVDEFGEHCLRHFRGLPRPPMFGLVTRNLVAPSADPTMIAWQRDNNRARLTQFARLWSTGPALDKTLHNLDEPAWRTYNLGRAPTRFDWNWTPRATMGARPSAISYPSELPNPCWGLNWTGSFDESAGYHAFVRMIPALNRVAAEKIAHYAGRGEVMPGAPASFVPIIYSPSLPDDLIVPAGTIHLAEPLLTRNSGGFGPPANSVTIATDAAAESNNELLAAAEIGYPVLAPDIGVYRENLRAVSRYASNLLQGFDMELPDMVADRAAADIYDALVNLIQEHALTQGEALRTYARPRVVQARTTLTSLMIDEIGEIVGWPN